MQKIAYYSMQKYMFGCQTWQAGHAMPHMYMVIITYFFNSSNVKFTFTCFLGLIAGHIYMPWHNWLCISMPINMHYYNCRNRLSCIHMPTDHPHYIVMYTHIHSDNHTHLNSRSLLIFFWFASTTTTTKPQLQMNSDNVI